jgi:phosphonate transport system substrate-binding protein
MIDYRQPHLEQMFSVRGLRQTALALAGSASIAAAALGLTTACDNTPSQPIQQLTVGLVNYDQGARSLERYQRLQTYLGKQTQTLVQLEPVFNELNAIDRLKQQTWSVVFAPPGLAAIAMDRYQYIPLLQLQSNPKLRSVLVIRGDSQLTSLRGLSNQVVALGQPGSAAGYYLPLYDLYGLTLAEIRFAPTPKTVLKWISENSVAAGALSAEEFEQYRRDFPDTNFRVLHTSRPWPPGLVLVAPTVGQQQQERIKQALNQADNAIADDAGYLRNASLPDYQEFIKLINKVKPIESQVRQKPATLIIGKTPDKL